MLNFVAKFCSLNKISLQNLDKIGMAIILTIISILIITGIVYLVNKFLPFKICPICAAVSLTWLLISLGISGGVLFSGEWLLILGILMGGTVVGIAYQFEKKIAWLRERGVLSKLLIVSAGFLLVYFTLINMSFSVILFELLILGILAYVLFIRNGIPPESARKIDGTGGFAASAPVSSVPAASSEDEQKVKDIEKRLEDCC